MKGESESSFLTVFRGHRSCEESSFLLVPLFFLKGDSASYRGSIRVPSCCESIFELGEIWSSV